MTQEFRGKRAVYEVRPEPIGSGGMADVYLANEQLTGKRVAIKWLRDTALEERFKAEAEIGYFVVHPNLVHVLDAGYSEARAFFVMDLLQGITLAQFIAIRSEPGVTGHQRPVVDDALPADRLWACRLAIYIARGLALLHAHGIVHRDVTPRNIFLCEGADKVPVEPKLLDFGIAKRLLRPPSEPGVTQHGDRIGSHGFMPPEQRPSGTGSITKRTDIWALGAVLYSAIEGHSDGVPYAQDLEAAPPSGKWDDRFWGVVAKALRSQPGDRYAEVGEFARALEEFAGGLTFGLGLPVGGDVVTPGAIAWPRFSDLAGEPPASGVSPARPDQIRLYRRGVWRRSVAVVGVVIAIGGAIGFALLRPKAPVPLAAPSATRPVEPSPTSERKPPTRMHETATGTVAAAPPKDREVRPEPPFPQDVGTERAAASAAALSADKDLKATPKSMETRHPAEAGSSAGPKTGTPPQDPPQSEPPVFNP